MKATAYEKGKMKKMYAPNKKVKIWIYIVSIFLVLLYLLPIYVMLNQSFRYITDLTPRLYFPEKWTLENYAQALFESDLFIGFKNSIVYVIEVCVIEVVLGGLAAYGLARAGGKISTALRTFNICIMMIPSLSLLVGTYSLMVKLIKYGRYRFKRPQLVWREPCFSTRHLSSQFQRIWMKPQQ